MNNIETRRGLTEVGESSRWVGWRGLIGPIPTQRMWDRTSEREYRATPDDGKEPYGKDWDPWD